MSDDPHGSAFLGLIIAVILFAIAACVAIVWVL
jgi:flagellar basal body-associated protein FliL